MISVIVPVLNEESRIGRTLERLRETSRSGSLELIVVDGGSHDRTREIAASGADQVLVSDKKSRGIQMHLGAQNSAGDPLVFLHADTRLPDNWQESVRNIFQTSQEPPAAAAFRLGFDNDKLSYKIIAGLARLRTWLTGIPHGDQALIVSRRAYFAAGGFPDVPLMEEYLFIPRLKQEGSVQMLREEVITSTRKYEKAGPLRNSLMNVLFLVLFYLGVRPEKLAQWYRTR